ncbi:hypothetical protein IWW38_004433, partial [Coemansia aciculifera]
VKADNTSLRLRMPAADAQIYENWADDFALAIFDVNKRRVAAQISYTSKVTLKKKGDYLVRVQIRHRNAKELEALKDAPLLVDFILAGAAIVKLGTTFSFASALTNTVTGSTFAVNTIARGSRVPIFFKTDVATLPSDATPGDIITGSLQLSKKTAKMSLEYIVPTPKPTTNNDSNGSTNDKPAAEDNSDRKALDEAIRKLRVEWIGKLKNETERGKLVADLVAEVKDREEDHAAVLAAQLDTIDVARKSTLPWSTDAKFTEQFANRTVDIADKIVRLSQTLALTARLYENQAKESSTDEDKKLKKQADAAKTRLTSALLSKCRALSYLAMQSSVSSTASDASGEFVDVEAEEGTTDVGVLPAALERAVAELAKWTDKKAQAESVEFLLASLPLYVAKQQYGRALQPVLKWIAAAPLTKANAGERKAMLELRDLLLVKLQWTIWMDHYHELALVETPAFYEAI